MRTPFLKTTFSVLTIAALATPAYAGPKAKVDTDGNGSISLEEFVLFNAEKDIRQRDRNKDGEFSTEEWVGQAQSGYRPAMLNRFDANGDGVMNASEVVDVYSFSFGKRDKDGNGKLEGAEIPGPMKKK